jgi:hypothetical protein
VKERAQAVVGFAKGLALFCSDDGAVVSKGSRDRAKSAFDKVGVAQIPNSPQQQQRFFHLKFIPLHADGTA